jgi:3-isopropylmalate/(R)-2-methylmalate dehydratase small subunit
MLNVIRGRVWKFGGNVDTDVITPGIYVDAPMEEMKKHVLEALNPRFPQEVKPGDIIVAGKNFGCGSSRETAPDAIKALGITAVIAESFARIFFRNAVAIGLPVVPCPGLAAIFKEGEEAEVNIKERWVRNVSTGASLPTQPLHGDILEILSQGGTISLLKALANKERTQS